MATLTRRKDIITCLKGLATALVLLAVTLANGGGLSAKDGTWLREVAVVLRIAKLEKIDQMKEPELPWLRKS